MYALTLTKGGTSRRPLIFAKSCFNCRHLLAASPAAKTVSQGCSASSAKSSRRCQWGLPGGGGQPPSSLTCPRPPVQTPQVTRDDITATSTPNTSCSLANIAARGGALRCTQGAWLACLGTWDVPMFVLWAWDRERTWSRVRVDEPC